ncbi:MAG TPA: 1-deoxy-D-xylulose-5-phosphate reductoisomerase [Candidatus Atribacteria bacterium]|nr:1-deoxy-D-xylulose-5-phosphate reductoisomerase [bacterium]HDK26531.1 1-deoxy-D-xylulose-5-phosphate reductoisomerase [Candidatus Atribacteria bacterium]
MKRKIVILGSTGSIGRQTLEVIKEHPDEFEIIGLSCRENIELLKEQIIKFKPNISVVANEFLAKKLKNELNNFNKTKIFWGVEGLIRISTLEEVDVVVVAITGIASLLPTLEAVKHGKEIAIASKESIVAAGDILVREAKANKATILPIDSEHSAILQCLKNERKENIEKIILTASGGPLYHLADSALKNISVEDALNHPTWKMGKKITIDSATLMNKGLEVIEARWLFDISPKKIEILIHPQSYIHSMIQFVDGTILAQLSEHDMRIPIQYALFYPDKVVNNYNRLDFTKIGQLTFKRPRFNKFPCIKLAYKALEIGGTMPAVLNGANEIAVNAFLNNQINITEIPIIIENTMKNHIPKLNPNLEDIFDADYWARKTTLLLCENKA